MNLIIHTQYYPPEIGAPQNRLHELSVCLVNSGINVTVLTAMPNYPRGRIYSGYGGCYREEIMDGVRVLRSAIYPTQKPKIFPRLINYFSFVISSLWVGLWKVGKADVILTESPPLFLGIAGLMISCVKRARWIFNISDLWPLSALELGIISRQGLGFKLSGILEDYLYGKAWLVTAQSKGILENIKSRFPRVRSYHLPNGVDTEFFKPGVHPNGEYFGLVYAGLHGLAQGLDLVIRAAQRLSSESIEFIFVGDGPEKKILVEMACSLQVQNIQFLEPVPKEQIPEIIRSANALLVPLKIQLTGAVPSKLYEAMSVGKPVILIADGEAAEIVKESDSGIVVFPGEIDALVDAILFLKNNPQIAEQKGVNGRHAAVQNHDRRQISEQFAEFLFSEVTKYDA
jgi:colanic acid biosynthesis glycosyl transferase WcaI